jgi:aminoglycoside phosphotransferase (APT) family kinase protein
MIKKSDLNKIVESIGEEISNEDIKECKDGYNSQVFDIKTSKRELIIKIISKSEENAKKDINVRNFLSEKIPLFPTPKTIMFNNAQTIVPFSYSIMSKIKGLTLSKAYEKMSNKESFFEQLGELKGELNSINNNLFGDLDFNLEIKSKYKDWISFIEKRFNKQINKLKINKECEDKFINELIKFWNSNKNILNRDVGPCFCHGDTSQSNILVTNTGKVSGIIDFEYAKWGGGIYDLFSSISKSTFVDHSDSIIKGYSKKITPPKNWRKLMYFYQWLSNVDRLSNIKGSTWRYLDTSQIKSRKKLLKEKTISQIKKLMINLRLY